ncbi:HigA family addiction module antitoxin [Pelomonas caseinilytica]|nr:HigA family addiction module antitoxin [Pelomonas sp. P7]
MFEEIHPGEILHEDFMKPLGISAVRLASCIGLSAASIRRLMRGNRRLTAETALRLGLFFSMEPRFWTNLQADYDLRTAARKSLKNLRFRVKPLAPEARPGRT